MTEILVNTEQHCRMFEMERKATIMVKAPSVENVDPKRGLTLSSRRQAPKLRGKLSRQNAQSEDFSDWNLDVGYGSSFSSSISSHSDYGSFDWARERNTPSDISDGKLEYGEDDSGQKLYLDIPSNGQPRKQISQASSGYWGDSEDLDEFDILNLSSASSVFSENEPQPMWEKDCEQLFQQLSRPINKRSELSEPSCDSGFGEFTFYRP